MCVLSIAYPVQKTFVCWTKKSRQGAPFATGRDAECFSLENEVVVEGMAIAKARSRGRPCSEMGLPCAARDRQRSQRQRRLRWLR